MRLLGPATFHTSLRAVNKPTPRFSGSTEVTQEDVQALRGKLDAILKGEVPPQESPHSLVVFGEQEYLPGVMGAVAGGSVLSLNPRTVEGQALLVPQILRQPGAQEEDLQKLLTSSPKLVEGTKLVSIPFEGKQILIAVHQYTPPPVIWPDKKKKPKV